MKIKTAVLSVVCGIAGFSSAQAGDYRIEHMFVSPSGTASAALAAEDSNVRVGHRISNATEENFVGQMTAANRLYHFR
jgi:hypothetical protein